MILVWFSEVETIGAISNFLSDGTLPPNLNYDVSNSNTLLVRVCIIERESRVAEPRVLTLGSQSPEHEKNLRNF